MVLFKNQYGDELRAEWDHSDLGFEWWTQKLGELASPPDLTPDINIRIPREAHEALLDMLLNGPHPVQDEVERLRVALHDMTVAKDTWMKRAIKLSDDLSAALEGHDD